MDREQALRILAFQAVVATAGMYSSVKVTNVSFTDADGQPFLWEETQEPYAIVNVALSNAYGRKQAIADIRDENYDDAVNHNLSYRVSIELGKQLQSTKYANVMVDDVEITDKDEEGNPLDTTSLALLITDIAPIAMVKAKGQSVEDLEQLLAKAPKEEVIEA